MDDMNVWRIEYLPLLDESSRVPTPLVVSKRRTDYTLILTEFPTGFLGSFLAKGLKTNQLELNTDEKTLRPIARLKEPRDLFALPKDKDHDCPQQAPRWPIECQVLDERVIHIPYVPSTPEPYNQPTGSELKPRPVGEENGIVVFNYNPISAVNYKKNKGDDSSDSDSSSDSSPGCSTPDRRKLQIKNNFAAIIESLRRSSSISDDDDDDDDDDAADTPNSQGNGDGKKSRSHERQEGGSCDTIVTAADWQESEDIWANKSPEYVAGTPNYIKTQFGKQLTKQQKQALQERLSDEPSSKHEQRSTFSPPVRGPKVVVTKNKQFVGRLKGGADRLTKFKTFTIPPPKKAAYNAGYLSSSSSSSSLSSQKTIKFKYSQTNQKLSNRIKQQKKLQQERAHYFNKPMVLRANIEAASYSNEFRYFTGDTQKPVNAANENLNESNSDVSLSQFSRSAVGGSKFLSNCHPCSGNEDYDGLEFESRFESGNLAKAVMITRTYYELYLRSDLYTSRSRQWFYFRVKKTRKNLVYRFSIVNLVKSDSLYNEGMRPLMYSVINAKQASEGWKRCGENIVYYRNDDENSNEDEDDNSTFTLTFNIEFSHDDDTVYFAHSYPYTYSDLQDYLMDIQKHPVKSKFCKLRLLCRSLAGNNVYYLTVTAPTTDEEAIKRKKAVVVSARVHPSETPSSWMMKGLMDFITGDSSVAKKLRHRFIFKLIPMLNPDGVIVGNTRNSLTGKDLNRQYRTVIRETYPSIWYTKAMLKRLIDECGVAMYCDMHAHSRKHNIFIYGCENKRTPEKKLTEQVFPLMMHKNVADKFSFEGCKFKIQRSKEGTGRIVVWMLGITNSYTIEASFGGSTLGSRKNSHFSTADYEHIGRAFCETLLDYCDENPNKERLRLKIIERLLKEGSSAEEPLNIPLSDYSSDEGDTSSSSDNEGKASLTVSDLEGPCCAPLKAPPCSPEPNLEIKKFKLRRCRLIMEYIDNLYFQQILRKRYNRLLIPKIKNRKRTFLTPSPISPTLQPANKLLNKKKVSTSRDYYYSCNSSCQSSQTTIQSHPDAKNMKFSKLFRSKSNENLAVRLRHDFGGYESCDSDLLVCQIPNEELQASQRNSQLLTVNRMPRVRLSRMLRMWLMSRGIIIFRKKKSKPRPRTKLIKQRPPPQRLPFDMPTTDPGSDILFSSDEDINGPNPEEKSATTTVTAAAVGASGEGGFSTVPRTRRILMQSELQRRYLDEMGGDETCKQMPPELIVTSPTKSNSSGIKTPYIMPIGVAPSTAPTQSTTTNENKSVLSEFPMIGAPPVGAAPVTSTRRTGSWHNLNNGGNKSATKSRSSNPFEGSNKDDLQFRLSLKKKIWTGVQPEGSNSGSYIERNRPLSWGIPPVSTQVAPLRKEKSSSTVRRQKDENEALLSACSQKLLAWQQQTSDTNLTAAGVAMQTTMTTTNLKGRSRHNFSLNISENMEDDRSIRLFRQSATAKANYRPGLTTIKSSEVTLISNGVASNADVSGTKSKKRKNPLIKLVDTTQIVTRLAKVKSSRTMFQGSSTTINSLPQPRRLRSGMSGNANLTHSSGANSKLHIPTNKFKTGGLVATATAQPKKKKFRAKISNEPSMTTMTSDMGFHGSSSNYNTGGGGLLSSAAAQRIITVDMKAPASSSTTIRRVKTKLRKKSKHSIHSNNNNNNATLTTSASSAAENSTAINDSSLVTDTTGNGGGGTIVTSIHHSKSVIVKE